VTALGSGSESETVNVAASPSATVTSLTLIFGGATSRFSFGGFDDDMPPKDTSHGAAPASRMPRLPFPCCNSASSAGMLSVTE